MVDPDYIHRENLRLLRESLDQNRQIVKLIEEAEVGLREGKQSGSDKC